MAARRAGVSAAAGEGQEHRGCAEGMAVCSSPGMSLTAPASGSCGRSLPGLPLLTAWGRKGTGRALAGHGQELLQLKLERPEKVKDDEMEGPPASSCLPPRAGESQPLWRTSERGYMSRKLHLVRAVGHPHILRWRTAKQPELQQKEVSELAKSPGSAETKSCMSCSSFLAALTSAQQPIAPGADRPTLCSPMDRRAWLRDQLPRWPRGRGSIGVPEPQSRLGPRTC
ncbi:uncharacterized protein [Haliaeetus albicilla]|uniref:uncharacterized protein isoform X1 n=1 Tax=Haliaeetus albicilla TaxID=8969 RepID=UPI0037E9BFF0